MLGFWIMPSVNLPMAVLVSYKGHSSFPCLVILLSCANTTIDVYFGSFGGGDAKVKQLCLAKLINAEPDAFLIISFSKLNICSD
jgi:hypothetical protein